LSVHLISKFPNNNQTAREKDNVPRARAVVTALSCVTRF